jgi:hypothetical protein
LKKQEISLLKWAGGAGIDHNTILGVSESRVSQIHKRALKEDGDGSRTGRDSIGGGALRPTRKPQPIGQFDKRPDAPAR